MAINYLQRGAKFCDQFAKKEQRDWDVKTFKLVNDLMSIFISLLIGINFVTSKK